MDLDNFTRNFGNIVESEKIEGVIEKGGALIAELSMNPVFVDECLTKILIDNEFMARQKDSVWPNEITVYRHPDRIFSILMYIWDADLANTIHDHNAWGLICVARGVLEETKYRRLDDGSRERYAELEPLDTIRLKQGQVTSVLPLNRGIHQMKNIHQGLTITFNAYGAPVKRGYICFYDRGKRSVKEAFSPRTLKRVLAARALLAQSEHAEQVLEKALQMPLPEAVREETRKGLSLFRNREFRST
jgi:predicted metal-dependent enzyme (double-stranded beta helix superfamily)